MEKIFYLAQVLGGLNTLFAVLTGLLSVTFLFIAIGIIVCKSEGDEIPKEMMKMFSTIPLILIISIIGIIFIPSKQTFLFMIGGRAVDSIVEDKPEIKELPGNTFDLLNEYIKAETEKVKTKNNKEN